MLERLGRTTHAHRTCRRDTRASLAGNPQSTFDGGKRMDDSETLQKLIEGFDVPEMRRDIDKPANVRWLLRNIGIRNAKGDSLTKAIQLLINLTRDNRRG